MISVWLWYCIQMKAFFKGVRSASCIRMHSTETSSNRGYSLYTSWGDKAWSKTVHMCCVRSQSALELLAAATRIEKILVLCRGSDKELNSWLLISYPSIYCVWGAIINSSIFVGCHWQITCFDQSTDDQSAVRWSANRQLTIGSWWTVSSATPIHPPPSPCSQLHIARGLSGETLTLSETPKRHQIENPRLPKVSKVNFPENSPVTKTIQVLRKWNGRPCTYYVFKGWDIRKPSKLTKNWLPQRDPK